MATVDLDKNERKSIKLKGIKSWISGIFTHNKNSSKKSENDDIKIDDVNRNDSDNKNNDNNDNIIIQHDYLNPKYVPKIMDEPIIISEDVSITYSIKHRKCIKSMENKTMTVLKKDICNVEPKFDIRKTNIQYNFNIYDDNNSDINNNILCNNFDNINNIVKEHTPEPDLTTQEYILSHDSNNVIEYDINHDVYIGYDSEKNDILEDLFS